MRWSMSDTMLRPEGGVLDESDTYREVPPPPRWRHVVLCTWEHEVATDVEHRVVPDGHADLIFFDSGLVEVVGVHDRLDRPFLAAGTVARGIRLRSEAVAGAFRTTASDIASLSLDAEAVLGASTVRRLREPKGRDEWIESVQVDPRIAVATAALAGQRSIREVAEETGVSERQLRRLFEADVGVAPKTYQSIVRHRRFSAVAATGVPLARAATLAGYADQSHAARASRRFAEETPAARFSS